MGAGGGRTEPALGPQDSETTYFCNTCGQPLCARCRDETHRARMFASHEIVALGQRSRDVLPKCSELAWRPARVGAGTGQGGAPALTAAPLQLCTRRPTSCSPPTRSRCCASAASGTCRGGYGELEARGARGAARSRAHLQASRRESRAHCVDLESAYVQGCERLEQAVLVSAGCPARPGRGRVGDARAPRRLTPPLPQAVKALQTATREAIALLQAMVEEVRRSAAEEEAAIHALFGSMQVRGVRTGRP